MSYLAKDNSNLNHWEEDFMDVTQAEDSSEAEDFSEAKLIAEDQFICTQEEQWYQLEYTIVLYLHQNQLPKLATDELLDI